MRALRTGSPLPPPPQGEAGAARARDIPSCLPAYIIYIMYTGKRPRVPVRAVAASGFRVHIAGNVRDMNWHKFFLKKCAGKFGAYCGIVLTLHPISEKKSGTGAHASVSGLRESGLIFERFT